MRKLQLILPILLVSSFLLFASQIKITKVSCISQYGPCPDEYDERLKSLLNRSLLMVSDSEVKKVLAQTGGTNKVRLLKHITGRLEVKIELNKPSVVVQVGDDTNKLYLVTLDGIIVGQASQASLPKLIIRSGRLSPEDSNFVSAVKLVELLARAGKIDNAEISGEDLLVNIDGTQALLPLVGRDPQVLVGSLQLILVRGTMGDKKPVKIDLRFKNAVVTY